MGGRKRFFFNMIVKFIDTEIRVSITLQRLLVHYNIFNRRDSVEHISRILLYTYCTFNYGHFARLVSVFAIFRHTIPHRDCVHGTSIRMFILKIHPRFL